MKKNLILYLLFINVCKGAFAGITSDYKEIRGVLERFKLTFVTIMFLLTFGCAIQFARDNDILSTYEGHHIDEIVAQWGVPTKSLVVPNGNTVYVYFKADIRTSSSMETTVFGGGASINIYYRS